MFPKDLELMQLRLDAMRDRIDVITAATCSNRRHQEDVEFYLAVLGWDLENFVADACWAQCDGR